MDEFWQRYESYIRSYVPQWQYAPHSAEVESALLRVLGELLLDSRTRLDRLPEKHERIFHHGWGVLPQAAEPMRTYAALSAPDGQLVPAGTTFYLSGDGDRLWSTVQDVQAETLELVGQVLVSSRRGKLIVLPPPSTQKPTRLFDFRSRGTQRQQVRFLHRDAFASVDGRDLVLKLSGATEQMLRFLSSREQVSWTLEGTSGAQLSVPTPDRVGAGLHFTLPAMPDGCALLVTVLPQCVPPQGGVGAVTVHVAAQTQNTTLHVRDDGVGDTYPLLPFGAVPEVWRTCCFACPDVLGLRGAQITMTVTMTMQAQEELLPGMDKKPEYRLVMRRLPDEAPEIRNVFADQVVWEYWNGGTWRPVPGTAGYSDCFRLDTDTAMQQTYTFRWPEDAQPCDVQGYPAQWLRWRVVRADGSGWLPRRSYAPCISDIHWSAQLSDSAVAVELRSGLEESFSPRLKPQSALFPLMGVTPDGWWLCFRQPPSGSTLQLFLEIGNRVPGGRLSAWEGETPLELVDGTEGLSHSGLVIISGYTGTVSNRFGQVGWWLCLREENEYLAEHAYHYPQLTALQSGGVCIQAQGADACLAGEAVMPLHGGTVMGRTAISSFGGVGEESDSEQLRRARWARHHLDRAVSAADVEQLLCGTVRDIVSTQCVVEDGAMTVGVLLRDVEHHAAAFANRRQEVLRLLKQKSALPSLGYALRVREPCFYPVHVMLWARLRDAYTSFATVQRALQESLDRFLHPARGHFGGRGWRMGMLPTELELRNYLQESVPEAVILQLVLTVIAPDGRELERGAVQDPFALPVPTTHTIREVRGGEGLV